MLMKTEELQCKEVGCGSDLYWTAVVNMKTQYKVEKLNLIFLTYYNFIHLMHSFVRFHSMVMPLFLTPWCDSTISWQIAVAVDTNEVNTSSLYLLPFVTIFLQQIPVRCQIIQFNFDQIVLGLRGISSMKFWEIVGAC
jgi:hypothetical protein